MASQSRSLPSTTTPTKDRKSTRLNSSHTVIYTLSLHDALPISAPAVTKPAAKTKAKAAPVDNGEPVPVAPIDDNANQRSEEHTSELQSHRDLHSFPTRRSSDLCACGDQAGGEDKGQGRTGRQWRASPGRSHRRQRQP